MTGRIMNFDGIPILIPNDITLTNEDFYISFNDRDINLYGDITTALVQESHGYPTKFLILNGDHTKNYNDIIVNGGTYKDCVQYFREHIILKSKFSDNYNDLMIFKDGILTTVKDDRYDF
jgi:hypothetical protein